MFMFDTNRISFKFMVFQFGIDNCKKGDFMSCIYIPDDSEIDGCIWID